MINKNMSTLMSISRENNIDRPGHDTFMDVYVPTLLRGATRTNPVCVIVSQLQYTPIGT